MRNSGWSHPLHNAEQRSRPPVLRPPNIETSRAPVEHRDRVYRALSDALGLSARHRDHLRHTRGLPPAALGGFASTALPDSAYRRRLAATLIDRLGREDALHGVPGFCTDCAGNWQCRATPPGFFIPIPNEAGFIQAFAIRADDGARANRYTFFSSRDLAGGCSSGAPVAVWRPDLARAGSIWITEGSLKAGIASWHLPACVLGVPGVGNWREVVDLLPPQADVVVAYDADASTNDAVALHRDELARVLFWQGHTVHLARWDPRFKGIDDALLNGAEIEIRVWPVGAWGCREGGACQ